ncbi:HK97 family phage prohead protease [Candidatus Pacearchaeota archaeon]|nr:HK97 family phage prohead protease [Candidatus Pacearchaeota archaeon]
MPTLHDFSGIATAYDVLCQDGRVIKKGAFDHQEGQVVPIVWRHGHKDIRNYLGHADLGVNDDPSGMRVNARFNDTTEGKRAKFLVVNKDIRHLSIYANELDETSMMTNGQAVRHTNKGTIREVSLVLAGKNPGAVIDDVVIHSDDPVNSDQGDSEGVIIHTEYELEIVEEEEVEEPEEEIEEVEEPGKDEDEDDVSHADDDTANDILKTLNPDQKKLFNIVLHAAALGEKAPPTKPSGKNGEGPTVQAVFDTLTEEQQNILYYMTDKVSQESLSQGDEDPMKQIHNIFEDEDGEQEENTLSHEQMTSIIATAVSTRAGSLRDAFASQESVLSHSVTDIDFMFPDAKNVKPGGPQFYSRPMEWVEKVLGACKTRPFARIKSMYADLTGADARAKGYVTAAEKVEEVIAVLKRVTVPQTIYKLQKLDRDDIIDITDFNVVVWLKGEMRMMLREELARAILISDGRNDTGADAILAANVRPIWNDAAVYTINKTWNVVGDLEAVATMDAGETVALIDYIAAARSEYRGSGSPVFYCQPEVLTKFLLVRNTDNLRIHPTEAALAAALRVSAIIEIPPMSAMSRAGEVDPPGLPTGTYTIETLGIIVNLNDYIIGMDKLGRTAFFDDFDLDFNKYTYLYETRLSGAMVNPKSAITIENVTAKTA